MLKGEKNDLRPIVRVAFLALSMLASAGDDGEDSEEEDTGDETVSKRPRTPPPESPE